MTTARTGRLASSNPNGQNIPESARHIFVAGTGKVFIGPDYSNLELRVIAYESGDTVLQKMFEEGKNIHDENTIALFGAIFPGLDSSHPLWKSLRKAAKIYIFGRNYGGTLQVIYQKVMNEAPECHLTFAQFRKADALYREQHPAYDVWCEKQKEIGVTQRRVVNAFGRVRILLGEDKDIEKESLNSPIQGTAADIVNTAMISFWKEKEELKLDAKIVAQVHDQLLIECPIREKQQVMKLLKKHMEQPFNLWGKKVIFPVEMKVGKDWGNLKVVKV
jgi:DNA polymerase-1